MTGTTTDIKPLVEQWQQHLRDRPARILMLCGVVVLGAGIVANVALTEGPADTAERWDGPLAIFAVLGGLASIGAIVVRIIQLGRREDVRQEVTQVMAEVELMRARREHLSRAEQDARHESLVADLGQMRLDLQGIRQAFKDMRQTELMDPEGQANGSVVQMPNKKIYELGIAEGERRERERWRRD